MNAKKMKSTVVALSIILVICLTIAGTITYLQDSTDPVVNTFAPSNIDLELEETGAEENEEDKQWEKSFQMVPGVDIAKDPKVTVTADIDCYVFVKVEAENGVVLAGKSTEDDYITYAIATGWELVPGQTNVYYQLVDADEEFEDVPVLAGNEVHVLESVTKEMMQAAGTTVPTLKFTAYAFQLAKGDTVFTPAEAWAQTGG